MKYTMWIMSSKRTVEADTPEDALCISLLKTLSSAPVAFYDSEHPESMKRPYDAEKVDAVLSNMWQEKMLAWIKSFTIISN